MDDVLARFSDFNIRMATQSQQHILWVNIHDRYINMVIKHLNHRFPDTTILEAFSMFDGRRLPLDEEELRAFGKESLDTLSKHYQLI